MRVWLAAIAGTFLTSCTLVELDTLVPGTAISEVSDPQYTIGICNPTKTMSPLLLADRHAQKITQIQKNADRVQAALPTQLAQDPVLKSIVANAKYASTNSLVQARKYLTGTTSPEDAMALSNSPKPPPISHSDLNTFMHNVAALAIGNTNPSANNGDPQAQLFWSKLDLYYKAYFSGNFITYFAVPLQKPTLATTITDTEIDNAALVFIEFVLDEVLQPMVWYGADGKYYPAGVKTTAPLTYLAVNNISNASLPKISPVITGCGMNYYKANTLNYLSQQFATAAVAETSLTVKTAGGLEIGLGIIGKLNIGDNSTLTNLISTLVTDVVKRLTIEVGAPILEAIDIEVAQQQAQPQLAAYIPKRSSTMARAYSSMFIKP
jgi:hypothetical protein